MKSHKFSQVIVYKVKTALKDMLLRNIIQALFKLVQAKFKKILISFIKQCIFKILKIHFIPVNLRFCSAPNTSSSH